MILPSRRKKEETRKQCVDEIIKGAEQVGYKFHKVEIDHQWPSRLERWFNYEKASKEMKRNAAVHELARLKRSNRPYEIVYADTLTRPTISVPVFEKSTIIGTVLTPEWKEYCSVYRNAASALESKAVTIVLEEAEGFEQKQTAEHAKNMARYQEALDAWKAITDVEMAHRYNEEKGKCPSCRGEKGTYLPLPDEFSTYAYDFTPCTTCQGEGVLRLEQFSLALKPPQPPQLSLKFSEEYIQRRKKDILNKEVEQALSAQGLRKPYPFAWVYVQVHEKELT